MKWSRRQFLRNGSAAVGTGMAGGLTSVGTPNARSARIVREWVRDISRQPLPAPLKPTPSKWSDNRVTIAWIGHSTLLINFYGLHVLTDPVFGSRVGLRAGLGTVGPKRYIRPALAIRQLPPIDLVLLSHAHWDHLDLPSLARLPKATGVITAHNTGALLRPSRLQVVAELGWGDSKRFRCRHGDLHVEAFEVRHWGSRWPADKPRGYNGYLLRREGRTLLFAGDTAFTQSFRSLHSRGHIDAAMMPIAAYNPSIRNHCTPEQALIMADAAGADFVIPMHHGTFKLGDEPMHEPMQRLEKALSKERERLALRRVGETFSLA